MDTIEHETDIEKAEVGDEVMTLAMSQYKPEAWWNTACNAVIL